MVTSEGEVHDAAMEGAQYVEARRLEKAKRSDAASLNARNSNMHQVGIQLVQGGAGRIQALMLLFPVQN